MANPAFNRNPAFSEKGGVAVAPATPTAAELEAHYGQPSANAVDTDRMTVPDTIVKSVVSFVVLLAGASVGWMTYPAAPWLWMVAGVIGFVLALVNIFKREPSAPLILAYAAAQGVFIGGFSLVFETIYPGIVIQAVVATFVVVGVTLALFASGKIRASKKATKVFLVAMVGYLVFSIVNVFVMIFGGANGNPWGLRGEDIPGTSIPWGIVIGILVVIMAAYSLVLDFDAIQQGVKNRAPRKYGWSGAFGIMVTVIWLYTEILRIFAIARN
ncbi:MAG: Bax inhibitor-1/YccA family protein [Leifsonia sp.]